MMNRNNNNNTNNHSQSGVIDLDGLSQLGHGQQSPRSVPSPISSLYSEGPFHESSGDAEEAGDDWAELFFNDYLDHDDDDMDESGKSAGGSGSESGSGSGSGSRLRPEHQRLSSSTFPASVVSLASASSNLDPQQQQQQQPQRPDPSRPIWALNPSSPGSPLPRLRVAEPTVHPSRLSRIQDLGPPSIPELSISDDDDDDDEEYNSPLRRHDLLPLDEDEDVPLRGRQDQREQLRREQALEVYRAQRGQRAARDTQRNRHGGARPRSEAFNREMDIDDELVEVELGDAFQRARGSVAGPRLHTPPAPPSPQQQQQQQGHHIRQPNVIDLTEEPDSPVHLHRPIAPPRNSHRNHSSRHRNPRRQMLQNRRTPALARSDGSILNANAGSIIDLTVDSPDEESRDPSPPRRSLVPIPVRREAPPTRRADRRQHTPNLMDQIAGLGDLIPVRAILNYGRAFMAAPPDVEVQFIGAAPANGPLPAPLHMHHRHHNFVPNNPLAGNAPVLNYQGNGFGSGGRAATPKPDFDAPPAARPGFTRNTGQDRATGEELVAVCPSCDEELKYCSNDDGNNPPPVKKTRTKKDREEHYFWAVKACGHVYCKSCYDNRKKNGKSGAGLNLNFGTVASATGKTTKTVCAVADCEADVTATSAWVGIFM